MNSPGGLGIHPNGNIYVVMEGDDRIQVYQPQVQTAVGEDAVARLRIHPPFPNPSYSSFTVPVEVMESPRNASQHVSAQVFESYPRKII